MARSRRGETWGFRVAPGGGSASSDPTAAAKTPPTRWPPGSAPPPPAAATTAGPAAPVLILDEPTDGLDPNQKHEVRTLINDMARDKIIVISTHILEEVDAVCTRAIIISRGRIVADDSPAGLAARSRYHNAVSMQLEEPGQLAGARDAVAGPPAGAQVQGSERDARLTPPPPSRATTLPAPSQLPARPGLKPKG